MAQGRVHTEYVTVESEHSALSRLHRRLGGRRPRHDRDLSQGLALHVGEAPHRGGPAPARSSWPTPTARCPRRSTSTATTPTSWARATPGWIIYFAETAQEAYDNTIMALRVAEHPDVLLPVMHVPRRLHHHALDRPRRAAWTTRPSRRSWATTCPSDALLDIENPTSHGNFAGLGGPYFEFKKRAAQRHGPLDGGHQAGRRRVRRSSPAARSTSSRAGAWRTPSTRSSPSARPPATRATSPASCATKGVKAGVLKIRVFRPFPCDRDRRRRSRASRPSPSSTAPSRSAPKAARSSSRSRSALYDLEARPPVMNYIYGLGGSDVKLELMRQVFDDLVDLADGLRSSRGRLDLPRHAVGRDSTMANIKELSAPRRPPRRRPPPLRGLRRLDRGAPDPARRRRGPGRSRLRDRLPRGVDHDLPVHLVADARSSTTPSRTPPRPSPASRRRSRACKRAGQDPGRQARQVRRVRRRRRHLRHRPAVAVRRAWSAGTTWSTSATTTART